MEIEQYLEENCKKITEIYNTVKLELEKLGFKLLEMDTNHSEEYEHPSWADFRLINENGEYNVTWKSPVDYHHSLEYSHKKDKKDVCFYNLKDLPESIVKIKNMIDESRPIVERLNNTINEALS